MYAHGEQLTAINANCTLKPEFAYSTLQHSFKVAPNECTVQLYSIFTAFLQHFDVIHLSLFAIARYYCTYHLLLAQTLLSAAICGIIRSITNYILFNRPCLRVDEAYFFLNILAKSDCFGAGSSCSSGAAGESCSDCGCCCSVVSRSCIVPAWRA